MNLNVNTQQQKQNAVIILHDDYNTSLQYEGVIIHLLVSTISHAIDDLCIAILG